MTEALIRCTDCRRPVRRSEPLWDADGPHGPKCGAARGLRHGPRIRARKPKTGVGEQPTLFDPPETEINEEDDMTTTDPTPTHPNPDATACDVGAPGCRCAQGEYAPLPIRPADRLVNMAMGLEPSPADTYPAPGGNTLVWAAEGALAEVRRWLSETGQLPSDDVLDALELLEAALEPHRDAVRSTDTSEAGQ